MHNHRHPSNTVIEWNIEFRDEESRRRFMTGQGISDMAEYPAKLGLVVEGSLTIALAWRATSYGPWVNFAVLSLLADVADGTIHQQRGMEVLDIVLDGGGVRLESNTVVVQQPPRTV